MKYEDEEVVLCHSPLDKYLEEVTDESFGKYDPQPYYITPEDHLKTVEAMENVSSENNFYENVCRYLPNKPANTLDVVQSCHVLLNSLFLCEEDQKMLMDLCEAIQKLKTTEKFSTRSPVQDFESNQSEFTKKMIVYGLAVLLFSVIISMVINWNGRLMYMSMFFMLLSICGLVYYSQSRLVRNIPKDIYSNVETFIHVFGIYEKLIDKTICHIKEVEIITRGYSQVNKHQTLLQKCVSNGKKCLKLRLCLMDGLTDLFNQLRNSVRIIIGHKKKNMVYDYKEEYIALMPLDAFSELLYSTADKNNEHVDVTPLDQLKAVVCLYRFQLSEYIYTIIIYLFMYHQDKVDKHGEDVFFFLEDANKNISKIVMLLEEQYELSVKLIFQKEKEALVEEKRAQSAPMLSETLHSSEIHLHAALARVEEMRTLLDEDSSSSKEFSLDTLHMLTTQFNLSLENAKFCVEDVSEKVHPRAPEADGTHINPIEVINEKEDNYVLFTKPSSEIGDMLYEGESDANARRESGLMNIEDVENLHKESRQSKKLMRELKTILSVKESPVGLVPFPLPKIDDDPLSDTEYACNEEVKLEQVKEKRIYKPAYVYDPDDDEDCVKCPDEETSSLRQQIGLPLGFLSNLPKGNMDEVTFGSSSGEEEEASGGML